MAKKVFACYLIDVRNDGGKERPLKDLIFHRVVVKEDRPLEDLQEIGHNLWTKHPDCDRLTIIGSGRKHHTQWLFDSANKVKTKELDVFKNNPLT